MHAKNLVIDKCSDRQAIKAIYELLPDADGITALAFVVEAVDSIDFAALVVTSQQEEVLLILDLVGDEQNDGLKRILAAINIVT